MFVIEADTPQEVVDKIAHICKMNAERCEREFSKAALQREKQWCRAQKTAYLLLASDLMDAKVRPKTPTDTPLLDAATRQFNSMKAQK